MTEAVRVMAPRGRNEAPFHCLTCGAGYKKGTTPKGYPCWRHPEPQCEKPVSDGQRVAAAVPFSGPFS